MRPDQIDYFRYAATAQVEAFPWWALAVVVVTGVLLLWYMQGGKR